MDWTNLYGASSKGLWLRGNLHTHAGEGMSLAEALARYAELGYDFLCISDHMKLTLPRAPKGSNLLIIPGVEWNSRTGEHMNLLSFDRATLQKSVRCHDQATVLRRVAKRPVLVVLNHPNWREPPHYSREQLMDRPIAAGLEIYNGLVDGTSGTALATEKWDYLLSRRHYVLGFANDDAHQLAQIGNAWIMVRVESRSPRAVFNAIRKGRFYCSTGATFNGIRREGMRVEVDTHDADEIWAVGEWGARLARVFARHMAFDLSVCRSPYVRFVAYGKGAAMAWTQPFLKQQPVQDRWVSPFVSGWRISRLLSTSLVGAEAPDLGDRAMKWAPIQSVPAPEGFVDVSRVHGTKHGLVYLATRVAVPRTGDWIVSLGHDGGARLFVDGWCAIDQPVRVNPAFPDRSQVRMRLSPASTPSPLP